MPLAVTTEQDDLAEAVSRFAAHHAAVDTTREAFASIAAGELPTWWKELVDTGFHAIHLPESVGGQGGTLADTACVVEAAAAALLPGPLLATITAGAVANLSNGSGGSAEALLRELAAGAPAAVVLPEHHAIRATAEGDTWRLSGSTQSVSGVCAARIVLIAVPTDSHGDIVFTVRSDDRDELSSLTVEQQRGTDLCTDIGILHLAEHVVGADSVLTGIDTERARALVVALAACAAAGTVRRCAEAATDYIRTREQFGKPVGTFQALQHKAAALLVNSELAAAAAWDAIRAAQDTLEQHRLAAATAALVAVAPSTDLVLDAMLMFGAIGYTWEHDTHLFWRRATSLAASIGPMTRWRREVGEISRTTKRSTTIALDHDVEPDFRAMVASALDRAMTVDDEIPSEDDRDPGLARGSRREVLAGAGLVGPTLPAPWGLDASAVQQVIIADEFARRPGLVRPSLGIAEWIIPTILGRGTDAQRDRFAEPTLRGDMRWCQLFSEPGAGSDLASLRTRASRVDGGWMINGHKIWTSLANRAQFGALLARTDPDVPKHRGISYFLIDMSSPGVEVRPIKQASGQSEFNEVFLTDVFVPDDMLVGNPGEGWDLAVSTMAVERTAIGNYVEIDRTAALRHVVDTCGDDRDTALQALGDVEAHAIAIKAMVLRETLRLVEGRGAGPTSSIAKYAMVLLLRRASTATLALSGRVAMLEQSDPAVVEPYFHIPAELIGGGTPEIQLTVIASMILGLPRK